MLLPRFYPILDTGVLATRDWDILDAADALLSAGAQILQFRHKADWTPAVYDQAAKVAELCRSADALFVVNDRTDIALLLDAALHIGQEDLPPLLVRRIAGPSRTLGFSTHNEGQLRAADTEPVDYVALGPIFGTQSKQNPDPVVGVAELARIRPLTDKPLVAIGGITRETAPQVWAAGADSLAVVGDLYPQGSSQASIRDRAKEWIKLAHEHPAA